MYSLKSRFGILLIVLAMFFTSERVFSQVVSCPLKQANCTYTVLGCYEVGGTSCPGQEFGYRCWNEYGQCCPGGGTGYSRFCSIGCDGTGGGGC